MQSKWLAATTLILLNLMVGTASAQTYPQSAPMSMTVSLASQVPKSGVISTMRTGVQQLQVMNGASVSLTRTSGDDYRLQGSGGWAWTQVQQVPANMESITLTPALVEGGAVSVAIAVSNKSGNRGLNYQSTVLVPPNQWVQLYGDASPASGGTRSYSTKTQSTDQLFIHVSF